MKKLFGLLLVAGAIAGLVSVLRGQKRRQEEKLVGMSDEEVRSMIHDKVAGHLSEDVETQITDKVLQRREQLVAAGVGAAEPDTEPE